MHILALIILLLFTGFFGGIVVRTGAMLERKRAGFPLDRDRLVFFFVACLMLVCLVPLWLFDLLNIPVLVSNLGVVLANVVGFILTFSRERSRARGERREEPENQGVRTYQVYYRGEPFGLVTKEGFDRLLRFGLLKKQRTVELVDDYPQQARQQGVQILVLQNRDGSQTLLKVEQPEE